MRINDIFTATYSPGSDPLVPGLGIPDGDDYYGNYCGANRVNGTYQASGQSGVSSDDMGPPRHPSPLDEFDKCCLSHDICLAKVDENFPEGHPSRNLEIKNCDARISACWLTAQFKERKLCPVARIKGVIGAVIMAPLAHVTNPPASNNGDVFVIIGFTF